MPDISMCKGGKCPLKKSCFRYRAIPGSFQSYFMNPPFQGDECIHFSKIDKGDKIREEASITSLP